MNNYICISPLEQFERVRLIPGITNSSLMLFISCSLIVGVHYVNTIYSTVVPGRYQVLVESLIRVVGTRVVDTIGNKGESYYSLIYTIAIIVRVINVIGRIPYSFTVTSHRVMTLTRGGMVWFGKRLVGIRLHGFSRRGRFLPAGTPFAIVFMMVPLEIRGFSITMVSLSVRLFANIMAGHILLKVIAGFSWSRRQLGGMMYILHLIPMIVLCRLRVLETAVAVIQAYVFTLLTCIYISDMRSGSH